MNGRSIIILGGQLDVNRSIKPVSEGTLTELARRTKLRALRELDAYYGGEDWGEIRMSLYLEGPGVFFSLTVREQPQENLTASQDRVLKVFRRHWDALNVNEVASQSEQTRDSEAWIDNGVALRDLGRIEEALGCFEQALEIDPRHSVAWFFKGIALHSLGRPEEALACFERALKIEPRLRIAWRNKCLALANLGRREEALAYYDQALHIDPHYADAWSDKGETLRYLDRPEEALGSYERALEIDPRHSEAKRGKREVLRDLRRKHGVIATWRRKWRRA